MSLKSRADLYKLLTPNPVCAEIGVAEGNFSRDMLKYWNASKVFSIDLWGKINGQSGDGGFENDWHEKNYQNALSLLKEFGDRSVILRGISWEMAVHVQDESLDFIHIDCCHSYECVKKDLAAWVPKVKPGGIISCHDIMNTSYGVRQAVEEISRNWILIPEQGPDASGYFYKE